MTFLGNHEFHRLRKSKKSLGQCARKVCSKKTVQNRLPLLKWIPSYSGSMAAKDAVAGLTVGATLVAQGMAYADLAGLPAEYGMYSGIMGGFIYFLFGNCQNMSIGPTAILSALVGKYVKGLSPDFAVLLAFLVGVVQILLAVFQLGCLVEFLSSPVILGFTAAAAIQICASQFKPFFGLQGSSGNTFLESAHNTIKYIKTINYYDTGLGLVTIFILILLKQLGQGCKPHDSVYKKVLRMVSLSRNVVAIIIGLIVSYVWFVVSDCPLTIVGEIKAGLPDFVLPPFSTTVGNETLGFSEMLTILGPQSFVLPLVAIMEVVIISKAFTPDVQLDATQEIIALGLSNLAGSFLGGMPVTGAFSRSALNDASGAQTPASGILVGLVMILSLSLITQVFYYIPKPSLAAMLMVAVIALVHFDEIKQLWRQSKKEFCVFIIVVIAGLTIGLEYAVIIGVGVDVVVILYRTARPAVIVSVANIGGREVLLIKLPENISYCSAEYLRNTITKSTRRSKDSLVIIDAKNTYKMDTTVISNILSMLNDIDYTYCQIAFMNFNSELQEMFVDIEPKHKNKFYSESAIDKIIHERY